MNWNILKLKPVRYENATVTPYKEHLIFTTDVVVSKPEKIKEAQIRELAVVVGGLTKLIGTCGDGSGFEIDITDESGKPYPLAVRNGVAVAHAAEHIGLVQCRIGHSGSGGGLTKLDESNLTSFKMGIRVEKGSLTAEEVLDNMNFALESVNEIIGRR